MPYGVNGLIGGDIATGIKYLLENGAAFSEDAQSYLQTGTHLLSGK